MIVVRTMPGLSFWRSTHLRQAAHLAWKDLWARRGRSALVVMALALSISGISGVRSAVTVALNGLRQGSREPLAGDLSIDTGDVITPQQYAALNALRKDGIEWTIVTIILTMASSNQSPDAEFVAVKAVNPDLYPFYGGPKLGVALRGDGVIVSENTLRRLRVHVGDPIRIGGKQFHITAVGKAEPDELLGILDRGLRCVMSRDNLQKSGIARGGNAGKNRVLFRLPAGADLPRIKEELRPLIRESVVLDYQDVNQNIGLRIEGLALFVSEMALLALALGSMGVAIAVRQHVEQRAETFAMMKMVGARNQQLVAIFLMEIALMGAAALPIGIALGFLLKRFLLSAAAKFFILPSASGGNSVIFLQAAGATILAVLPASAGPIWMLCRLRPAPFLRKESRHLDSPGRALVWASTALLFAALLGVSDRVLGAWDAAFVFCGGLFVGALLTLALAKLSLRAIAVVKSLPAAMRLGVGNLTRPGNRAALLIATISTGAMMMVATLESGAVTMRAVEAKLPYDLTSSLLIAGFQASHREQILSLARSLPGVESAEMKTQVSIRLIAIDGVPVKTTGSWYVAGCAEQNLSIDRAVARRTGATTGSRLDFILGDRRISETVASVTDEAAYPVRINCDDFNGAHLFNQAVVHVRPGKLFEVEEAIRDHFPTLAVVTAPEIEAVIDDISRDTKNLARLVAALWVVAGLGILMTLVAASRSQRLRETGVLSALGATPKVLAKIYTIEFACIGAIAGIIGSGLACGLSCILLGLIFHRWEIVFGWWTAAAAVVTSTVLTAAAGWMPTFHLLRQKPMNVLRGI